MLDFPNSPTNGQNYTSSGKQWTWDGTKWLATSATAGGAGGGYQTGPGLAINYGTTPPTIDVATPYLPLTGGTVTGVLTDTSTIFSGELEVHNTSANSLRLRTTGRPVDTNLWELWSSTDSFFIRAVNDAYSAADIAIQIVRSGYSITRVWFPSASGVWIGPNATQAAIGAGDANYTYIKPPVPGGTIFVGSGSNSNYYINNIHIWQNQSIVQTASLDSGGNFIVSGALQAGWALRAINRSNSANYWELYVSSNVATFFSSSSGDMFKIDTSGNATLAGNVLRFVNGTGVAVGAGGPLIYGDSNWTLLKTGINNQGWMFWDYNGTEIFRFDASSPYYLYIKAAKFLSTDGTGNAFNKIHDTSGGVAIYLGGGTDHTNYFRNTNHNFAGRDVEGSPSFMDISGSSTTIHQATHIYGGLTIHTGNLWVGIGDLWVGNGNVNCSSINSFNYYLGNQTTSDAGTYGFSNSNGPSMVTWGSSSTGVGSMELRTSTGTHLTLTPSGGGVNHYKALQHYFYNMDASIEYARIDYVGTRNISGTWLTYSDLSIKRDIEPYERGLEAIAALNPISYWLKPGSPFYDPNRKEKLYGLISQDVRDIIPEMVSKYDHEELESLAPGHLVFVLVNAVKELKDRLEALEAKG